MPDVHVWCGADGLDSLAQCLGHLDRIHGGFIQLVELEPSRLLNNPVLVDVPLRQVGAVLGAREPEGLEPGGILFGDEERLSQDLTLDVHLEASFLPSFSLGAREDILLLVLPASAGGVPPFLATVANQ